MNQWPSPTGVKRWGVRQLWMVLLIGGCFIFLLVSGYLPLFRTRVETKIITLTGRGAAGKIEVPVLNLWARPGFGPNNTVQGRVSLLPAGEVKAKLLAHEEVQGLSWYEVETKEGTGWAAGRFVVE